MTARSRVIVASSVQRQTVDWLWPGRIPRGSVSLIVGDPGLGKSTLAVQLAAWNSRGQLGDPPARSLILTAEDNLSHTVRPRLEAAGATLDNVGFLIMDDDGMQDSLRLPDDVDELEAAVADEGATLVVVDPVMAHLGDINSWKDQEIRKALAPLHRLAERQGCAIVGIAHLTKGRSSDPLTRTSGSIGLPAAARSALLLARDPDDEEGEQGSRRILAHWKCNLASLAPSLAFEIRPVLLTAHEGEPEIETSAIVQVGESAYGGRDLLGISVDDPEHLAETDAAAFLVAELEPGPLGVTEIKSRAGKAGHAWRTVERAKASLGISKANGSVKRIGGVGATGEWTWELPANTATLIPPPLSHALGGLRGEPLEQTESLTAAGSENGYHRQPEDMADLGTASLADLQERFAEAGE